MAILTAVLGAILALMQFWKAFVVPKLILPTKAHFALVHESARAVQASNSELIKIKAELTNNGGQSLKDLVCQLHKDLRASGLSVSRLEGLVQAIFSASKEGVWMADERGECLWVNGWFAQNIGWMPHEMHGAGWKNTVHPDCRTLVFAEWEACLKEHRDFILDFAYTTKSGEKVEVHARCSPIRQNSGTVIIGHVGFVQQVS